MLKISNAITIPSEEIQFTAIRAQGPGGQNVNKVSTAIQLKFDIQASSLPESYKKKLLNYQDYRISKDGIITIKAQRHRTQTQNKDDALERLVQLIKKATKPQKARKPTKPTKASQQRRLDKKAKHGKLKALRSKRILD